MMGEDWMQKNRKKEKKNSTKRDKGRKMMQEGKREKSETQESRSIQI